MRSLIFPLFALVALAAPVRADEKADADQVKVIVETYLKNQGSPTRCDDNLELCLENAVHLVTHKKDSKLDVPRTIKQLNAYIKGALKDDLKVTIDSVKVDVKENTGLAVAFASLRAGETSCYSVFTVAKRDGKWKVVSITQENR
jgi:hypothetical protein